MLSFSDALADEIIVLPLNFSATAFADRYTRCGMKCPDFGRRAGIDSRRKFADRARSLITSLKVPCRLICLTAAYAVQFPLLQFTLAPSITLVQWDHSGQTADRGMTVKLATEIVTAASFER
jgi:hypothetical protein